MPLFVIVDAVVLTPTKACCFRKLSGAHFEGLKRLFSSEQPKQDRNTLLFHENFFFKTGPQMTTTIKKKLP